MDTSLPKERREALDRLQWWALAIGVVTLLVCGIGALGSPQQFFRAYLVAYLFFLGIAHGCLVVVMIYHLTGGAWGFLIRRVLEAGMRTLPLFAALFVPIGLGVDELYDWARPDLVEASPELQHKEIYLNVPFFWIRAGIYFALWIGIASLLSRWSREQDRTGDPRLAQRLTRLSGPGLVVYGVTITFASVDWVMSLQPAFRSTIFGPLFASGEILTGFACALIALAWLTADSPLSSVISVDALNDLGNLLFTFLVIWAYMTFFEFMLIWIANLPYDVIWYLPRLRGGWLGVAWSLVILHFAVPFFLLLSRDVKRNPRALAALAGLIVVMHLVYMYYQVMPAFPDTSLSEHWMDLLTPFAVGGLWLAYCLADLKQGPLLPQHDPNESAALRLAHVGQAEPDLPITPRGEVQHG
jgi:hypothetical protein